MRFQDDVLSTQDLADVEQILRQQAAQFDRAWVKLQLIDLYGKRDLRIAEWESITSELPEA